MSAQARKTPAPGTPGTILVTGGAGYIGSHCALALMEAGRDILIFDSLELGHLVGEIFVGEHRATEHHHMHRRKSHVSWRNAKVGIINQFGIDALIITSTIEPHILLQMIFADQLFQIGSLRPIAHKGQVIFLALLAQQVESLNDHVQSFVLCQSSKEQQIVIFISKMILI